MPKISAYILTFNEAEKIEAAVSSVLWADEVVVVDSFSTDRTAEIATSLGARVVEVAFNGFGDLRNRALAACQYDWIFSLDADERCTEEVRDEVLGLLPDSTPAQVMDAATVIAGAQFIAYGTWKWAELHSRTGQRPVYRYYYTHPRPAAKDPVANPPHQGAVHSGEIEYLLGNLATNLVYSWTSEDFALSDMMGAYVANFVTTGNPNGADLPRWPAALSGDSVQVMVLDVRPRAEPSRFEEAFRFLDRINATNPAR
jgi:glycosyltransferase involved in cell wall biosynthesis